MIFESRPKRNSFPSNYLRSRVRWKPHARFWGEFGGCKTAIRFSTYLPWVL